MELKEWLGDNELSLNIWKNKYQRTHSWNSSGNQSGRAV